MVADSFIRFCTQTVDPKRLQDAIAGLNAGFLAVVATLKLQFAKVRVTEIFYFRMAHV